MLRADIPGWYLLFLLFLPFQFLKTALFLLSYSFVLCVFWQHKYIKLGIFDEFNWILNGLFFSFKWLYSDSQWLFFPEIHCPWMFIFILYERLLSPRGSRTHFKPLSLLKALTELPSKIPHNMGLNLVHQNQSQILCSDKLGESRTIPVEAATQLDVLFHISWTDHLPAFVVLMH